MNLLQRLIESLLFFHPVVWFLSHRLSAEREICCDDLVVRSGHQPMNYAGALLRMAELCVLARHPQLVSLSATGRSSTELEHRIVRLMQETRQTPFRLNRIGMVILSVILIASFAAPAMFGGWSQQDERQNESETTQQENTAPEKVNQQLSTDEAKKLLATLRDRDREFENRTLNVELRWDELMSPHGDAAQAAFHMRKLGAPDTQIPQGLPDNYQQPHRVQYSWTRRGEEAIVERFADLEKAVDEKFSRMENHGLDHADPWKYLLPCGVGFSDQIDSITAAEITDDGYVIRGLLKRWSAVIDGRQNSFVVHLDKDLIIRRAELKYHVYDFVVVTWGTHQSPDAPETAEHGDFTKYYCVTNGDRLGERSGIAEHYAYQVINVSDSLTDEEFDKRVRSNPLKKTDQNGIPELTSPGTPDVTVSVQKAGTTGPTVDATNPPEVEIKYPHCVLNIENLPVRTLVDSIAAFNLTSQESPAGVFQPPITEQETRDAMAKFAAEKHVPGGVRTQLEQILKSGELPSNVYFRRFTRFDDGKQMQDVWWVRLVVETGNGPVYSVPVRTTSLSARPYTQLERQQNASENLTLLNRVSTYVDEAKFRNMPSDVFISWNIPKVHDSEIERFLEQTEAALRNRDLNALLAFHDWRENSESTREFVTAELNRLLSGTVHYVWYSPREGHQLTTWSAWQFYKPNLPVAGYLKISYSPEAGKENSSPDDHQILALELGVDEGELRLVNYIKDGPANPPQELNPGPSITGHLEPLADGTHLVTDIITNPGSLLSAHLANEEIRLRDFQK